MKIKQKVKLLIIGAVLSMTLGGFGTVVSAIDCAGTNTLIINCDRDAPTRDTNGDGKIDNNDLDTNGAWKLVILTINVLTAGVGIAGVGGIVYGSIRYATAGGNFATAKKALGVITNTAIGLGAYALMFAIMNYVIPGGLFAP